MNPLEAIRQVLTWLCGVPHDESASKWRMFGSIVLTLNFIVLQILCFASTMVFIHRNASVDLESTLYSSIHTFASGSTLYQSITTVLLRRELAAIFDGLAKIYNENMGSDSYQILLETNQKCEKMWPFFFKFVVCGMFVSNVIMCAVSMSICYILNEHFEAHELYHPFSLALPWNRSTPIGYSFEILFGIYHVDSYFITTGSLLVLFISMCLHHQTFYEIFRNEAKKLDSRDKHRNEAEHLRKMICFHVSTKDWYETSADTYSPFVLVNLIANNLFFACSIFQLDLLMAHPNFKVIIIFQAILNGASTLLMYCYFGKMATESYERMADCMYECNWLDLSPKSQKYLVLIIANAQKKVYYHGFGLAVLDLQTFNGMIKTVFSCYMMFKTLTTN